MASKILLPLLLLAAASLALAVFDVTKMLVDKSQYGSFLKVLTQTKVAEEVNRLKSVSLLVLSDKNVQPISSLPADKQRLAISNHVLLKYFDPIQLDEMKDRTAMLSTLLSNTDKRFGFVNYTKADDGQMYFGSSGATCVSKLIKVVAARPYAISIMEVSEAILPPGLGGTGGSIGGRRPKGGKGKVKPSSAGFGESKMSSNPVGEAATKELSAGAGSEAATPSEAPTAAAI